VWWSAQSTAATGRGGTDESPLALGAFLFVLGCYNSFMNKILQAKKAFIFDMDGVLTDSENLYVFAEQEVCRNNGITIPDSEWQNFKGRTNKDIFTYINSNFGNNSFDINQLIDQKRAIVLSRLDRVELFPGVIDFLKFVRNYYSRIGLTTSTSRPLQEKIFNFHQLNKYFDEIVTGDQVAIGKPNPEAYILTLQKLGVTPDDAIVIEDSDNGIIAAKAAGCFTIGISHSFPREILLKAGADIVVDTFPELRQLLEVQ
jgi:HAD superfamily hydrolase (TIGR01509 family)